MSETECQARLYGGPREIVVLRPADAEQVATLSGARIRRLFERRLGRREREAA